MSRYEVRCHHCDVSFPPDTKRCLYCGAQTGDDAPGTSIPSFREVMEREVEAAEGSSRPVRTEPAAHHRPEVEEADEEEFNQSSLPRVLSSLVWVFLLIGLSLYRACAGG